MNQQSVPGPSLLELLGRTWHRPGAIAGARFGVDGTVVAFASVDGTLALARVADTEPPENRIRISSDLGQMRILPRSSPPAPLIAISAREGEAAPLAPFGQSGFVYGSKDGTVTRLSPEGETAQVLLELERPALALDHSAAGEVTAASDGERLYLARLSGAPLECTLEHGASIGAISFSPDGRQLAGLLDDGLAIWELDAGPNAARVTALPSRPVTLRWRADGQRIACGLEAGGYSVVEVASGRTDTVLDFPAPVRTISWSEPAGALVASGAFRIAAWSVRAAEPEPRGGGALMTGRAGLVLVEAVAAHPIKDLVAAGYANGRVVVARIGERDELPVRLEGGAVTVLEWSPNGQHLAIGDDAGKASLVAFPPQLFK